MKVLSPLVILVIISVLLSSMMMVSAKDGNLPGHEMVDQEEFDYMPNPEDSPEMNTELSCSACSYSVKLMQGALEKVKLEFQRQPEKLKEYHALAAIDDVCKKHFLHVGLLGTSQKSATTEFIHEQEAKATGKGANVLKGGWITRFFNQKCEDMLTEAEDNMGKMMKGEGVNLCPSCEKWNKINEKRELKQHKKDKKKKKAKKNEDL